MLSFLGFHAPFVSGDTPASDKGSLATWLAICAFSGTLGIATMATIQGVISYGALWVLFGDKRKEYMRQMMRTSTKGLSAEDLQKRANMASTWRYFALLAVFCFAGAGLPEELLKYLPLLYVRWRGGDQSTNPQLYLSYAIAASFGFSLVEMVGYVYSASKSGERGAKLGLTIFERVVIGLPGHINTACLSAILGCRGGLGTSLMSVLAAIGPSICYHGLFNFAALAFSASEGNVGWIHPENPKTVGTMLALAVGVQLILFGHVRREWLALTSGLAKHG